MRKIPRYALFALVFNTLLLSCSSDKMKFFSINCICVFTETYSTSTNEEDNRTKEYSFTNSPLFKYGVPKEDFALSSALQIRERMEVDSLSSIRISLVSDIGNGKSEDTSYDFSHAELAKLAPRFSYVSNLVSTFVKYIYSENHQAAYKLVDIQEDQQQFSSISKKIRSGLEEGYTDTRIVSYEKIENSYLIYGGVHTESKVLDLFKMELKDTKDGLKIVAFEF